MREGSAHSSIKVTKIILTKPSKSNGRTTLVPVIVLLDGYSSRESIFLVSFSDPMKRIS